MLPFLRSFVTEMHRFCSCVAQKAVFSGRSIIVWSKRTETHGCQDVPPDREIALPDELRDQIRQREDCCGCQSLYTGAAHMLRCMVQNGAESLEKHELCLSPHLRLAINMYMVLKPDRVDKMLQSF
jgi:hypothetical protein